MARETATEAPLSEMEPPVPSPPATWQGALGRGVVGGLHTTWELAVVMVPVYFLVTLLKYSPFMPWLSRLLRPAMGLFGLPGDAAVPLVGGLLINFYVALGAVAPLGLTPREVTVLGLMLVIAHSLPMEGVVLGKLGARGGRITLLRGLTAAGAGVLARLLPLGQ